jgi:hypothetical protein
LHILFTKPTTMKKYFLLIAAIILVAFSSCNETTELSDMQNQIIGAYRYTGNNNGMGIYSEKHFIFVPKMETEVEMLDSSNTSENKTKQIIVEAGTWTLQDTIITNTFTYHSNPAKIGTSMQVALSFNGNDVVYYVLGKDNEVIRKGSAIKLD